VTAYSIPAVSSIATEGQLSRVEFVCSKSFAVNGPSFPHKAIERLNTNEALKRLMSAESAIQLVGAPMALSIANCGDALLPSGCASSRTLN